MKIIWRDTDLKRHEIDLSNAVDVKISGITIAQNDGESLKIQSFNQMKIMPIASNAIIVKEEKI